MLLAMSGTQRTQREPCLEGREIRRTDSESSPAERLQAVSRRSCMTPLIHKGPIGRQIASTPTGLWPTSRTDQTKPNRRNPVGVDFHSSRSPKVGAGAPTLG